MDEAQIAAKFATHTAQIKELFKRQECLDEMLRAITTLNTKMESVEVSQKEIKVALDELKGVPTKRYNAAVTTAITALISGCIGVVLALLFK